jgi:2,3-bisphosphoglycerate-dependent phosphoglycerate mutase
MLEELFLIRHAMPDRAMRVPYNIPPGPPLTEQGKREAEELAEWLEGRGLEQLLVSPFERTSATAAAVVERLGIEATFVEALREGGPGESMDKIRARVAEVLAQVDDSPLQRVGFVTHGACVKALLEYTTLNRIDLRSHVYDHGNCAPTAGVWHGTRFDHMWRWELIWRPSAPTPEGIGSKLAAIGKCVFL